MKAFYSTKKSPDLGETSMNPDEDNQEHRNEVQVQNMAEKSKKKGGIKTMPFILGNEVCEKMAMLGFTRNMVNYLSQQLHMPLTKAANTVTNYNGTSSLTPLLGAFIADSYAGKFWTISVSSLIYLLGMILLTISAALPQLRPPPCVGNQVCKEASGIQVWVLYLSLLLTALGSGGIRPCVAAFGAEQFVEEADPDQQTKKTWVYFNWYYFSTGAGILIASTFLVYIQDNVGWAWGLGVPTMAMAASIVAFLVGFRLYRNFDPAGSPYVRVLQVVVAAFRKRKIAMVSAPELFYENMELDASISMDGMLRRTMQLKFLDKAAIVTDSDNIKSKTKPNLWRVNTVHRVEELKCIIKMLPIWAAGILFTTATTQQSTFSLQQANTMDKHLSKSFQIPSASLSVFTMASMLITIVIYDRLFVPFARKFTGLDRGITVLQRMGIGFFIAILATLVAGFIEVKRKNVAFSNGLIESPKSTIPISVFWLVPQYGLFGISEAFMSIGHLEFFYSQSPESMRSTATALFWTAIAVGSFVSSIMVSLVHRLSSGADGSNWIPDNNLNKGKLEYFYWLITVLQGVNFVYYLVCTKWYIFKAVSRKKVEHDGVSEGVELSSQV